MHLLSLIRSYALKVSDVIDSLNFGDLITVEWFDASEAAGPLEHGRWDTPVQSVGYFLGIKGHKTRHVVIAKEIVNCREYHYNVLPIGMIQSISIQKRNALSPRVKHVLKKFVARTLQQLEGNDGWAYATEFEGANKKSLHYGDCVGIGVNEAGGLGAYAVCL